MSPAVGHRWQRVPGRIGAACRARAGGHQAAAVASQEDTGGVGHGYVWA